MKSATILPFPAAALPRLAATVVSVRFEDHPRLGAAEVRVEGYRSAGVSSDPGVYLDEIRVGGGQALSPAEEQDLFPFGSPERQRLVDAVLAEPLPPPPAPEVRPVASRRQRALRRSL